MRQGTESSISPLFPVSNFTLSTTNPLVPASLYPRVACDLRLKELFDITGSYATSVTNGHALSVDA